MNLVLYTILKLLSRPVVCTNFQGLETNTCFSASALNQGHSRHKCSTAVYTSFQNLAPRYLKTLYPVLQRLVPRVNCHEIISQFFSSDLAFKKRFSPSNAPRKAGRMTRNAKPGLPRAVDGAMGAPQRFWGGSVIYNGKKVKIALYLAVFVTRDREGYVMVYRFSDIGVHGEWIG